MSLIFVITVLRKSCVNDCFQLQFACGLAAVPDKCVSTWYYSTNASGPFHSLETTFAEVTCITWIRMSLKKNYLLSLFRGFMMLLEIWFDPERRICGFFNLAWLRLTVRVTTLLTVRPSIVLNVTNSRLTILKPRWLHFACCMFEIINLVSQYYRSSSQNRAFSSEILCFSLQTVFFGLNCQI